MPQQPLSQILHTLSQELEAEFAELQKEKEDIVRDLTQRAKAASEGPNP